MSKLTPAIIDPTTPEGIVAGRNFIYAKLLEALKDAPESVRNLVGRCKMHEFFNLYRPKMNRGSHWHSATDGLFVRYQHYRQAEALFIQCRYAFYPEQISSLLPISILIRKNYLGNPASDEAVKMSAWGGVWAKDVQVDKHCFLLDMRYPQPLLTSDAILVIPAGQGRVCQAWVSQVITSADFPTAVFLAYTNDIRDVFAQIRRNIAESQPFFFYTPPA